MVAIHWTNEAELWLRDIHSYIAKDSKRTASKVVSDIYNKVQILKNFPTIGYAYDKSEKDSIRILLYGHYRIAYVLKEGNVIDILGVFHGSLDIERYL